MIPRFGVVAVLAERGREQACDVAVQEKDFDRHLRGDKRIVRPHQIGKFAPPEWQRLLVQCAAE